MILYFTYPFIHNYMMNYKYYYYISLGIHAFFNRIKVRTIKYIADNYLEAPFEIRRHQKYIEFIYVEDGVKKELYFPVNEVQSYLASQCTVTIIYDEKCGKNFHQDADIPVLVTANDLGAKHVQVLNNLTCEERIYEGNDKIEYFAI